MEFQPYDKVLVRKGAGYQWRAAWYSHKMGDGTHCTTDGTWNQCIYYEGNQSLLGTKDDPDDAVMRNFRAGDHVEVRDNYDQEWSSALFAVLDHDENNHPRYLCLKQGEQISSLKYYNQCRKADL